MKIAKFNTLAEAQAMMTILSDLARHPTSTFTSLGEIFKSNDGLFFWFDFQSCIEFGGHGKEAIEAYESQLNITNI